MQNIDRKSLYTSLESRVEYLHSFLDFGADDVQALALASKYIKTLIPAVVNLVYKKLLKYDITARAFTTRSTSYSGPVDSIPDENSPQIKYRKMFLRGYLQKLCSDPSKFEFWEYLDKVGMMHVGMGRKHPLHVEYIHIGVCLGYIQDVIFEAILSHPRLRMDQKMAIIKALGKVMWIQNDLFAKWYVRDGAEFEGSLDEIQIEAEGVLRGKKVVDPEKASDEDEEVKERSKDTSSLSGGCPFSAMMRDMEELALKDPGFTTPKDQNSPTGARIIPHVSGIPRLPVEKVGI
ncbi:Protoglobin-domain-containing protein [Pyronema domesticum]|uniref:Globin-sensor domain-containing protein n=1 Tax=Pyronema omphalodes (strain CBS 100304) TaxID=1076935 RepID=U4L9P2_PYROM|nr:Protoglobin-domain-containing protein [Pyronema domesticum]CCX14274.1 Similar to hypothetical protein SS1G_08081 [Sclerotinia sclerotiorum 1980]; acc. no. XP_001591454 [Pyronema omphalodes CBS 100304]